MTKYPKCLRCGVGKVRPQRQPGRVRQFRNTNLHLPVSVELATCQRCGGEVDSKENHDELLRQLNEEYQTLLSLRARNALASLQPHISKRRLEIMIDLSQGYLSKVSASVQAPSAALVSLLALLASDPARLRELEKYWLLPVELLE